MSSILDDHSPNSPSNKCEQHNLLFGEICLFPGCDNRWMCRVCKLNHSESHLKTTFPLPGIRSGETYIEEVIEKKEKALTSKMNEKGALLKKVNSAFFELQNELEKMLIETKTKIIQTIEDYYLDLNQYSSHTYFMEIKEYLKKLCHDIKNVEVSQSSSIIEEISTSYSRTMNSLDYILEAASKFEDESLNFQEILDLVRTSCDSLSKSLADSSKEQIRTFFAKERVKVAPQTVTCIDHCTNKKLFVTGGNYGLLTFWDENTFAYSSHLQLHDDSIVGMAYFPDLHTIVTSSKDKTLGILIMNEDGNIYTPPRMETQKIITQLARIEGCNKLATISEKGNKIRIWEFTSQRLENVDSIEIPPTLRTSKMFCLGSEKVIAVTYENQIKLFSLTEKGKEFNTLKVQGKIISSCFLEQSCTLHALVGIEESDMMRYQEVIWVKSSNGEYSLLSKADIENTYGEPLEVVANSYLVFTVFEKGFVIKKAKKTTPIKFMEVLAQDCEVKNKRPIFVSKTEPKIMIPGEMKKLKIYDFS